LKQKSGIGILLETVNLSKFLMEKITLPFFQRMGLLTFGIVSEISLIHERKIKAVGAGVRRIVKLHESDKHEEHIWYFCDLKVHPDSRGQHLPLRMLGKGFPIGVLQCSQFYAITMDPSKNTTHDDDDKEETPEQPKKQKNRVFKLFSNFSPLKLKVEQSGTLVLFTVTYQQLQKEGVATLLLKYREGPISFLSLNGIKDIILRSTQQPMPLLHIQFGVDIKEMQRQPSEKVGTWHEEPLLDHSHMFCCLNTEDLVKDLAGLNIHPTASATIISSGVKSDWKFIRTSEI